MPDQSAQNSKELEVARNWTFREPPYNPVFKICDYFKYYA